MVSKGFLIDPPECFPLVFRGLLWYFPNKKLTQGGGGGMILMRSLGIIPILDSLRSYLNEQWFRLWCQTRSSLSSRPKRSSVDHSLDMSSLVISAPIAYVSASSKLVGIGYGILVGVRRSSYASSISPWTKIRVFQVSLQRSSLVRSYIVANMGGYDPFWYLTMSSGARCPMETSLVGAEVSDKASESGSEVGPWVSFLLGVKVSGVGSVEGGFLRDSFSSNSSG